MHDSPWCSSGSEEKKGDPAAIGCPADPKSCRNPGMVNSIVRAAPPAVGSASNTSTCRPAWASTMAAASPFGPEPTTHALRLNANPQLTLFCSRFGSFVNAPPLGYSLGCIFGHSTTLMPPSGRRSSVCAYRPNSCLRHHIPVTRFSDVVVNQYCQSTARIWCGGSCEKGLPAKSASTSWSFASRRTSVLGTIGYSRQDPREANHKFQSKRG